jgi:prepilin-type processing-associated H-X9-DG protein
VELLVVIGIIALLIAILLPVLSKARKQAAMTKCISNLKQLMQAEIMYANDNNGFLPYVGNGDAPGTPKGGDYYANWLYAPPVASAANGNTGVAVSGAFTASDVQSGALYQYLNTPNVYRCPLDTSPPFTNAAGKPLFNALTSYTMNIWMSNFNSDPGLNGSNSNHHLHRITEFHPYTRVFWDYPAAGALGDTGTPQELSKADPASYIGTGDRPCISGRHGGPTVVPATIGQSYLFGISGGCPMAYLDGHASNVPFYEVYNEYNTDGPPLGTSPYWVSPTAVHGGWDLAVRALTDLYSPN